MPVILDRGEKQTLEEVARRLGGLPAGAVIPKKLREETERQVDGWVGLKTVTRTEEAGQIFVQAGSTTPIVATLVDQESNEDAVTEASPRRGPERE